MNGRIIALPGALSTAVARADATSLRHRNMPRQAGRAGPRAFTAVRRGRRGTLRAGTGAGPDGAAPRGRQRRTCPLAALSGGDVTATLLLATTSRDQVREY